MGRAGASLQTLQSGRRLGWGYEQGERRETSQSQRGYGSGEEEMSMPDSARSRDHPPETAKQPWRVRLDGRIVGRGARGGQIYGESLWNIRRSGNQAINRFSSEVEARRRRNASMGESSPTTV